MPINQKYVSIFRLSFYRSLRNYKALIGLSIFLVTCLVIFANLWKIAAAKTGVVSFNPKQLLWYIAFNEWVIISLPDIQEDIEQDLQSGRLAYQLPRPVSYLGSAFAEAFGSLTVNLLVLGGVAFLFTWWQTGGIPFHYSGLLASLFFGFAAGALGVVCLMLIGLSSFWLHDVSPFYWIWEKLLFMFGGLILPLTVYPQWMQTCARFTPFPAILGERSALALELSFSHVLHLSASLFSWLGLSLICLMLLYRKSLSILNVEGG